MLFDAQRRADLGRCVVEGFRRGIPEIDGERGFDDIGAVLDAIERLPVQVIIPGHGAPFTDVAAALARSRSRLASFKHAPERHARHAAKVMIKYHVMEERRIAHGTLLQWAAATPFLQTAWQRFGTRHSDSPALWCARLINDLVGAGVLARDGADVLDR